MKKTYFTRATKKWKSWRAMITHMLEGDSTENVYLSVLFNSNLFSIFSNMSGEDCVAPDSQVRKRHIFIFFSYFPITFCPLSKFTLFSTLFLCFAGGRIDTGSGWVIWELSSNSDRVLYIHLDSYTSQKCICAYLLTYGLNIHLKKNCWWNIHSPKQKKKNPKK